MRGAVIFIACCILTGCADKNALPAGVLNKDKMQQVMWDMMKADAYTEFFIKKDTTKKPVEENIKLQQAIFKRHNVTKDVFYKSYNFYTAHSELMRPLLDSISAKAERERTKVMEKKYGAPK